MSHSKASNNTCLYCGQQKKLTKEHFWSKWVRRYLPRRFSHTSHAVSTSRENHVKKAGKFNRPGDPYSQTLRKLCQSCNSKLGILQEECKSVVMSLVDGSWAALDVDQMQLAAKWAVMFTMTCESAHQETMATPAADRKSFVDNVEIPDGWQVWIAPLRTVFGQGVFNHFGWGIYPADHIQKDPQSPLLVPNTQSTAFIVGQVFFMTYSTTSPHVAAVDPAFAFNFNLRSIWPTLGDHCKRPLFGIDEITASTVACCLAPEAMPKRQNWETI